MSPAPPVDLGPAVVISHASSTVAGPRHSALHVLATRACRSTSTHCNRFIFGKDIYMDAKFTELVEQLNGLDFKGMYGSDFLHTWDKTTDELKRSTSSPTPCASCARTTFRPRSSIRVWPSPCSVTTPPVRASPSLRQPTCSALSCRTWTRRSPRSLTARPSARPLP